MLQIYAVTVLKDDTIVGHIPKKISGIFIPRGSAIACTPIGGRRHSVVREVVQF